MCCFSGRVEHVSATSIFARALDGAEQVVAYAMSLVVGNDVAMVLPIPVAPGAAEDAVRFIDLAGYPTLFADLKRAFPEPVSFGAMPAPAGLMPQARSLQVHEVGAFEASFVPAIADFARLDPRFRLPASVADALPAVRDFGFAVFKLKPRAGKQDLHPMAFAFPRRDATTLFFPTLHIHDGELHDTAGFDHSLYAQLDENVAAASGWQASAGPIGRHVDAARAAGVVDGAGPAYRLQVGGAHRNEDVLLPPPRDPLMRYQLATASARSSLRMTLVYKPLPAYGNQAAMLAWRQVVRARDGASVVNAIAHEVRALEAAHRAWRLAPYDAGVREVPAWHSAGPGMPAAFGVGNGPYRKQMWAQPARAEPQAFDMCFAAPPDNEPAIREELSRAVDRAVVRLAVP